MNKVCCLPQRQNGEVLGLVRIKDVDHEVEVNGKMEIKQKKVYDLETATFVMSDIQDGQEGDELAIDQLLAQTNVRARHAIRVFDHTTDEGTIHVYDMDVKQPIDPKTKDPDSRAIWINPWHLVQGPQGELAKEVFKALETPVREPAHYERRKNKEWVPEEPEEAQDDIP